MRIALITPGFSANVNDWAIPALQTLAVALANAHDLHVFSLRYPAASYSEWGGFRHHAIGGGQRFGFASPGIWWQTMSTLINQHRKTPFDIIHAFWADEPGLVAVLAGLRIKRPVVVSIGGGELSYLPDIAYGTQRSFIRSQIIRISFKGAKAVTAGSTYQHNLTQQQKLDMDKARRVPLGVDTNQFQPGSKISLEHPTIIQAASLTPVKNQALLLETTALIKRHIPNIQVKVAGDGPLRPQLESLAQSLNINDNVHFVKAVAFDKMTQFFQQGHLYLQSSRHESQGMAVLEAMACGLPVLGTPVGVTAELAAFPATNDPGTLASQAVKLLCDPNLYKTHSKRARQVVVTEYNLDKTVECFVAIYNLLVNQ
jgi:glycosyltransferase involved in cell wall biosynthesis